MRQSGSVSRLLARERSRALHVAIAHRIAADETILRDVRERVKQWLHDGNPARHYAEAWACLLSAPVDTIVGKLAEVSDEMHELRQVSPFSGVLDPRTRWQIHRDVTSTFRNEAQ